ncbi:hypothetical protein [Paenibacillus hunanensis]|uniref:Uncharacterized protein n=1 Tax=Paenibacillus hunanensis TaxID=539262 RepID=A0ABU1IVB0_9BACL|nr:hypothetical protein [Paenibacillus hunanensis]MDR6243175.1 hypothetical protein [Paenibacillus hunanensis]GGJ11281.1 hypothetical protein GCM10008022_20500 [Paenibacillus hunanensis]
MTPPIPRRNEPGSPPGEVSTSKWTPEQIAEHLSGSEAKMKKAENKGTYVLVDDGSRNKKPKVTPDMAEYLKLRAQGYSRAYIAIEWGLKETNLTAYWIRKWGIGTKELEHAAIKKYKESKGQAEQTPSVNVESPPAASDKSASSDEIEWFIPGAKPVAACVGIIRDGLSISRTALKLISDVKPDHMSVGLCADGLILKLSPAGMKLATGKAGGAQINSRALARWIESKKIKAQRYEALRHAPGELLIKVEYE